MDRPGDMKSIFPLSPIQNLEPRAPSLILSSFKKPERPDIHKINREVFKNSEFRPNQEEIINAALNFNDIFVCMPTGGGKSLTFQLPAVVSKGITIVIMPLISLIHDQLTRLENLGIRCKVISGSIGKKQEKAAFAQISSEESVKIIFLTPEKLSKCEKVLSMLQTLYEQDKISRFVIDEAHCVSKWGREFRADYLKLSSLRKSFPKVPILALTGTATDTVRKDVVSVLSMRAPKLFLASFNRTNLNFSVCAKSKNIGEEIANLIIHKYKKSSGLIYCVTKKDCEKVSKHLKTFGIVAGFYHADIKQAQRHEIQEKWMEGTIQVLVATIAFGMGIDKKDVRFVIHYSFPKSLENYYQEAGRAGRDGLASDCIIYYEFADKKKHCNLINENQRQEFNFHEIALVMKYCENVFVCRRKQILSYFGENFDEALCRGFCDNCKNKRSGVEKDFTNEALLVLDFVKTLPKGVGTMIQVCGYLKGNAQGTNIQTQGNKFFGALQNLRLSEIETVLRHMIYEEILSEKLMKGFKRFKSTKLQLGPKAVSLKQRNSFVIMTETAKFRASIPLPINCPQTSVKVPVKRPELEGPYTEKRCIVHESPQKVKTSKYEFSFNKQDIEKVRIEMEKKKEVEKIEMDKKEMEKKEIEKKKNVENKEMENKKEVEKKKEVENKKEVIDILEDSPGIRFSYEMTTEMIEELECRLRLVRKTLSRIRGVSEECVLADKVLKKAAKSCGGELPVEFIREINFFKEIHEVNKTHVFELDLEAIDATEIMDMIATKKLKKN